MKIRTGMSREHEVRLPYYRLRTVFLVPGSIEIKNMKIAHLHQQNLDIGIKVKRNTYLIPSSQSHSSKIHIKKQSSDLWLLYSESRISQTGCEHRSSGPKLIWLHGVYTQHRVRMDSSDWIAAMIKNRSPQVWDMGPTHLSHSWSFSSTDERKRSICLRVVVYY